MTTTSKSKVIESPKLTQVMARFLPETVDAEKRTVELEFSSDKPYMRYSWVDGPFMEILGHDPSHVRMERLNNKGPLLDSHRNFSVKDILGTIEKAWLDGNKGKALVRFSQRPAVKEVMQDVVDGIVSKVSVGYVVHKFEREEPSEESGIVRMTATDWEPLEVSLVGVPADDSVGVRSQSESVERKYRCVIVEKKNFAQGGEIPPLDNVPAPVLATVESVVSTETAQRLRDFVANVVAEKKIQTDAESIVTPRSVEVETEQRVEDVLKSNPKQEENEMTEEQKKEVKRLERKRAAEIRAAVLKAKLGETVAEQLINDEADLTVEQAKARVLDLMADASPSEVRGATPSITAGGQDEVETRRAAVESAILHRLDPRKNTLSEPAREFTGRSLLEIGRMLTKGSLVGRDRLYVAERALHSSSDFPLILANVQGKILRADYAAASKTFLPIVKEVFVSDFKQQSRVQLGDAPALVKVLEGGEITKGTIGEGKEVYSIATYAKMFAITRQAIINDDLNAFASLPSKFARQAAALESQLVWGEITANAAMGDTVALFHASHGNLGTTGAISVTTLGEARKLMRLQEGLGGIKLNLVPKYLIVPVGKETLAEQYVTQTTPTQGSEVNPFSGKLTIIAEPLLDDNSATAFYLAADPGQLDMIELARLEGQSGPVLESSIEFNTDGLMMKARMDVGAKVIDHRGFVKNAGA